MATKLTLYNNALMACGERALASLTENREPRRLLDTAYDSGAVRTCLEAGLWNFATRAMRLEHNPSLSPDFGFEYGFSKPDDWVRTAVVSYSEFFETPLKAHEFADEVGYWWASSTPLYVKYVSDDTDYGGNLAGWSESFSRYVELYLASRVAPKLTKSQTLVAGLKKDMVSLLKGATAKDAQNQGTSFPPEGGWNRSRRGGGHRERGSRSQLIG